MTEPKRPTQITEDVLGAIAAEQKKHFIEAWDRWTHSIVNLVEDPYATPIIPTEDGLVLVSGLLENSVLDQRLNWPITEEQRVKILEARSLAYSLIVSIARRVGEQIAENTKEKSFKMEAELVHLRAKVRVLEGEVDGE